MLPQVSSLKVQAVLHLGRITALKKKQNNKKQPVAYIAFKQKIHYIQKLVQEQKKNLTHNFSDTI